jgi:hypothetical protein
MAAEAEAAREARAKVNKSRDPQVMEKCMLWSFKNKFYLLIDAVGAA